MQIVNGRHKQETSASLHSTGAAAGFAGRPRGLRKSIGDAEKARIHCGVPPFKTEHLLHISFRTREGFRARKFGFCIIIEFVLLYYHSTEREGNQEKQKQKNRDIEIL